MTKSLNTLRTLLERQTQACQALHEVWDGVRGVGGAAERRHRTSWRCGLAVAMHNTSISGGVAPSAECSGYPGDQQ